MISKRNIKTPPTTQKQKEILFYLLKFRFLNTHHIQQFLKHKNPNRTLAWIKDLIEKGCIKRHFDRKSFGDNTKPAIYYLAPKARHIIIKEKELAIEALEYIYKEHRREKTFINRCLSIADIYLFLLSQKEKNEELKFFTKFELCNYKYFPDPLPDAFIAVKGEQNTRRYFLDFFDEYTPSWVARQRVRNYLEYIEKTDWDENTDNTPFPSILFVCPTETMKKHIKLYSKALFEKSYDEKVSLFLTTKMRIQHGEKTSTVWQKVS